MDLTISAGGIILSMRYLSIRSGSGCFRCVMIKFHKLRKSSPVSLELSVVEGRPRTNASPLALYLSSSPDGFTVHTFISLVKLRFVSWQRGIDVVLHLCVSKLGQSPVDPTS